MGSSIVSLASRKPEIPEFSRAGDPLANENLVKNPLGQQSFQLVRASDPDLTTVLLENVLTPNECIQLLSDAINQCKGAWESILEDGNDDQISRKCRRIMWDSHRVVGALWPLFGNRVSEFHELEYQGESWTFTRLNERMRFIRYGKGDYFKDHTDCFYETPDGIERSLVTICLYLNDDRTATNFGGFQGGNTLFFLPSSSTCSRIVKPKAGSIVLFPQEATVHATEDISNGYKYIMRTDMMYRRKRETEDIVP